MEIDKDLMDLKVARITPKELHEMMQKEKIFILDVGSFRTAGESKPRSYIPGTVCCPLEFLHEKSKDIPKDQPIVVADILMRRSPVAARFLSLKGYNVRGFLKGGVEFYREEGLDVVEGDAVVTLGQLAKDVGFPE